MDIQNDKDFAALPEVAKLYQACKERDLTIAEREYLKGARDAWQAAKAQAVPDLSELQERIAGHQYYHDEHGYMVVDMDDVVKEISGFDSWKAQAVPEWISVKDKLPKIGVYVMVFLEKQGHNPTTYNFCQYTKFGFHLSNVTHWMPLPDAPQEPAND